MTPRAPDVAALHLRQAQLTALDHADEFFNGDFGFGHSSYPINISC